MTRKEEIREASTTTLLQISCDIQDAVISAFQDGARWADRNPKSPWISVKDDLPCNHKDLISTEKCYHNLFVRTKRIIVIIKGVLAFSNMYKTFDEKWHWITDEPSHWLAIPELPKE